jgi:hypothetical protein
MLSRSEVYSRSRVSLSAEEPGATISTPSCYQKYAFRCLTLHRSRHKFPHHIRIGIHLYIACIVPGVSHWITLDCITRSLNDISSFVNHLRSCHSRRSYQVSEPQYTVLVSSHCTVQRALYHSYVREEPITISRFTDLILPLPLLLFTYLIFSFSPCPAHAFIVL